MLRSTTCLVAFLAGCSQYALHGGTASTKPGAVDTAAASGTATDTATTTDPPDTASPDVCYDPAYGYDPNPAARLFTTDGTTPVEVSLVLSDTGYNDSYTLDAPVATPLADAWSTSVGTAYALGPYGDDSEVILGLNVQNTGDHWESGPSDRNADGVAHVAVTYEGGCSWVIGFEDLYGGGDLDYNDVVLRVQGMLRQQD